MVSVCDNRYTDYYPKILISNAFDNGFDLFFACLNPTSHGACAIDDEHDIETLASEESLSYRLKSSQVFVHLLKSFLEYF